MTNSLTVEVLDDSPPAKAENQGAVGVNLGVSALATLSTGQSITGPKAHKALLYRLQRLSRSLSRKVKGPSNRHKAKLKLAARAVSVLRRSQTKRTTGV